MFAPYIIKKSKKKYVFHNLKPTTLYFNWYSYNLKSVNITNSLIIPKVFKKKLVKVL